MSYCPCCGGEYEEREEVCLDCMLPLLPGNRPEKFFHLCDCDDKPFGEYLTKQLEGAEDLVKETIRKLTGFKKEEDIEIYIKKVTIWNTEEG